MAVKKAAKAVVEEVVSEVKGAALGVNNEFEGEIDPYLLKWAGHPVSGWIAVGFGVGLLIIGAVIGAAIF